MQGRELQQAVRDVSISSFFYLEFRLRPDGTLNFERIVLSLVYTKIAGAMPTGASLQVLESEVRRLRMLKNARIWSKAAALMRAQVLKCPGFRLLENDEHLLFVYHSNESQSRSPAMRRRAWIRKQAVVPDGVGERNRGEWKIL